MTAFRAHQTNSSRLFKVSIVLKMSKSNICRISVMSVCSRRNWMVRRIIVRKTIWIHQSIWNNRIRKSVSKISLVKYIVRIKVSRFQINTRSMNNIWIFANKIKLRVQIKVNKPRKIGISTNSNLKIMSINLLNNKTLSINRSLLINRVQPRQ